jgi:hypothetical protein
MILMRNANKLYVLVKVNRKDKYAALRSKSKEWLAQNQNNVSRVERHVYPWTVVSVSWHYKNPAQRVVLEQGRPHHHLIEN